MISNLFLLEIHKKLNEDLSKDYTLSLPAIKNSESIHLNKPVTFFVGENGSGKSSLLEAIAVNYGFNPEGGSRNFTFSTKETHSRLHEHILLVKGNRRAKDSFFLRAESFYNVATEIERLDEISSWSPKISDYYGGKSLHHQSHGESFLALVINRLGENGLYLFDEPEAALSPARQMTLLTRIHQLVQQNSQLIIATHSPILTSYPHAEIFEFDENGINPIEYKQTESYQITKRFLDNPSKMLSYLLD